MRTGRTNEECRLYFKEGSESASTGGDGIRGVRVPDPAGDYRMEDGKREDYISGDMGWRWERVRKM
jgi:hypothetical protein